MLRPVRINVVNPNENDFLEFGDVDVITREFVRICKGYI